MTISIGIRRRVVAGVAVLAAAASFVACRDTAAPPAASRSELPDSADQMMFGMKHALTAGGVRRADLRADTALFYDQGNRVDLRRVNTVFYTVGGAPNGTMVAQRGALDQRTQVLDARGDVVVTSVDGRKLTSPHVVYERSANQITSDTSFVFTRPPNGTLSGIGFRADPQLRNVTVLRGAGGTVRPSASPSRSPRR